jgi:hypothetical protein
MTSIYDWVKENLYYFLGPSTINRFCGTAAAVTLGAAVSLPFDQLRVRLHTMRPLPNGVFPYLGTFDALNKVTSALCSFVIDPEIRMQHSQELQHVEFACRIRGLLDQIVLDMLVESVRS